MLYLPIIFKKKKDYLSILNKLHSLAEQLMKDRELRKNETRIFCKYILQPNVREKKKEKGWEDIYAFLQKKCSTLSLSAFFITIYRFCTVQ